MDVRRALPALAGLVAALAMLSGCAASTDPYVQELKAGTSAVASARRAVELLGDGRVWSPYADTVLSDGMAELTDALATLADDVPEAGDREHHAEVVDALRMAVDAVAQAREAIADEGSPSTGALDAALDALDRAGDG